MTKRISGHIRSNIVGCVALMVAVIGMPTAWAVGRNSIGSGELKRSAVRTSDIAKSAVTSPKVEDGSLTGEDFAQGQVPGGAQGPQGPAGPAGSPDTGAQILGKLGVEFLDVNSTTVADPSSDGASEQVLVDGPAFDLVGRCTDDVPIGNAQVVVRSGSDVASIGVDSDATGGVVNDFTAGAPPPDQLLLSFNASPNQIESGSYSVTAIGASGEPISQITGMVSAGPFVDTGSGFNDCFFSVTAMG